MAISNISHEAFFLQQPLAFDTGREYASGRRGRKPVQKYLRPPLPDEIFRPQPAFQRATPLQKLP